MTQEEIKQALINHINNMTITSITWNDLSCTSDDVCLTVEGQIHNKQHTTKTKAYNRAMKGI